jgi:LacI family transcriptional regulator
MPPEPVTLLELARRMNVSKATISLALRGRPGVSEALRARILAEAERCGYKPNPVAVELMSIIQSQRHATGGETIAFLNMFRSPSLFREIPGLMDFFAGARAHAAQFGYTVELFDVHAPNMTIPRLIGILKARGVRGLLVGPRWRTEADIDFPWSKFSAVLVGESAYRQKLYRVCNHHTRSCSTALQALEDRGYRRIGLALLQDDEVKHSHSYLIGAETFLRSKHQRATVLPLIYEREPDAATIGDWVARNKLDAVVALQSQIADIVGGLKTAAGEPVGFGCLSVPPARNWSGIQQHPDKIGAEAVNLLRNLLLSGERGEATYHRVLLIEGEWVDGDTARKPGDVVPGAKSTGKA